MFQRSPVETMYFENTMYYLKRDDLLHADFSGNKARKLAWLLEKAPLGVTRIVSYGSNQSNAMYSLSALARIKGWEFIYVCDHVPSYLKYNPIGNYAYALNNGMQLFVDSNRRERAMSFVQEATTLFIEEGGAQEEAAYGIKLLAKEIELWAYENKVEPSIFLPSGTGATALYLERYSSFDVFTCNCVGKPSYLEEQFRLLEPDERLWPTILPPPRTFHYGKPKQELYTLWKRLKQESDVEFDLVYDPVGWVSLLHHQERIPKPIMYIHQGGIKGNVSMLERYRYKGIAP